MIKHFICNITCYNNILSDFHHITHYIDTRSIVYLQCGRCPIFGGDNLYRLHLALTHPVLRSTICKLNIAAISIGHIPSGIPIHNIFYLIQSNCFIVFAFSKAKIIHDYPMTSMVSKSQNCMVSGTWKRKRRGCHCGHSFPVF